MGIPNCPKCKVTRTFVLLQQCSTRQNDSNQNAHPNEIYHRSPLV